MTQMTMAQNHSPPVHTLVLNHNDILSSNRKHTFNNDHPDPFLPPSTCQGSPCCRISAVNLLMAWSTSPRWTGPWSRITWTHRETSWQPRDGDESEGCTVISGWGVTLEMGYPMRTWIIHSWFTSSGWSQRKVGCLHTWRPPNFLTFACSNPAAACPRSFIAN